MGKRGQKAWQPTDEEVIRIRLYSGLGMTQEQIATLIGKSVDTLKRRKATRDALDAGKAETIAKVAGKLVQQALSGNVTAAIFFLKTQAGWTEKTAIDHSSSDGTMSPPSLSDFYHEVLKLPDLRDER